MVNRRILHIVSTKMNCSLVCDVHEYTPKSVVLVEVIQVIRWTSAVNLSYDRIDCEVQLLEIYKNYVAIFCFQLEKFPGFPEFLELPDATSFPVTSFS